MVALPGVIEDLLAKRIVHHHLICILAVSGNVETLLVDAEAVVRPEGVVEGKVLRAFLIAMDDCRWAVHFNATDRGTLFLALVKRAHTHCYLYTHIIKYIYTE